MSQPPASPSSSSSSASVTPVWGCVELGGTTIKVAVAEGSPTNVIDQQSFPTGDQPAKALQQAIKYFEGKKVTAFGIGSFGPIDLNPASPTYGYITSTPKPGWQDFDVLSHFKHLGVPIGWNTDVNTAAFGEMVYGEHGSDVTSCVYVTVGTGIGAGIVAESRMIVGILHPEAGHITVRRHPDDQNFAGVCPFHGDCLEGLATANAVAARLGIRIDELARLPEDHPVWDIEAYYLAQLCVNMAMIVSPHVIILGGGMLKRQTMFPRIRREFGKLVNNYLRVPKMSTDRYIVPSRFEAPDSKTSAGCVGTLAYAQWIYEQQEQKTKQPTNSPLTPRSASKL